MFPALLVTLASAALFAADTSPKFIAPKTLAELEARIKQVLDSTKTPGVGLAIVRHDSVLYAGGIGLARRAPDVNATAATLFRIGSTSKQFVALTALALEREGKLSLNDPLSKRLPGFYFANPWEATDPVRIVHLLEHTAGFDDNSLQSYANSDPTPLTLAAGLAIDSATRVSRWRPGTRFSYCNTGPAIVARIIEIIEGKPFEQVIQERWFTPLGMRTATYLKPDSTQPAAVLYRADGSTPVPYWHVFMRPAGSINASALDMAQLVRFLTGHGTINGTALLPPESIDRMGRSATSLASRAGLEVSYGLHHYRTTDSTGFTWTSHGGSVEGGLSDLSFLPKEQVGYAFQINAGNGKAYRQIATLVRAFLTAELPAPVVPVAMTVNAGTRAAFAGWYHTDNPRQQHLYFLERLASLSRVTFSDANMTIAPLLGAAERFVPVDSTRYRSKGEGTATLVFVRDAENDRPFGIETVGASLGQSWERVSGAQAWTNIVLTLCWIVALVLSLAAALFGGVRWLVRKARKRETPAAAARSAWTLALGITLALLLKVGLLAVASDSLGTLGTFNAVSCLIWVSGLFFALLAAYGIAAAVRVRAANTTWGRISGVTVRAVLVAHAIAAAYLAYWGAITWRTWA